MPAKTRTFNPDSPDCAKITPIWRGARYQVGNDFFTAQGEPVDVKGNLTDVEFDEAVRANKGRLFIGTAKKAASVPEVPADEAQEPTDNEPDDEPAVVDLHAWATGTKSYKWPFVKKTIKERFGVNATSKERALETLVEESVITMEESGLNPDGKGMA